MNGGNTEKAKNSAFPSPDKTVINTGRTKYSFTDSWVKNEGLKDILVGLIADDLNEINQQKKPDDANTEYPGDGEFY